MPFKITLCECDRRVIKRLIDFNFKLGEVKPGICKDTSMVEIYVEQISLLSDSLMVRNDKGAMLIDTADFAELIYD